MYALTTLSGTVTATTLDLIHAAAAALDSLTGTPAYFTPEPVLLTLASGRPCAVPYCEHTPEMKASLGGDCFCAEDCDCAFHGGV